jgi:hypothetical protein
MLPPCCLFGGWILKKLNRSGLVIALLGLEDAAQRDADTRHQHPPSSTDMIKLSTTTKHHSPTSMEHKYREKARIKVMKEFQKVGLTACWSGSKKNLVEGGRNHFSLSINFKN